MEIVFTAIGFAFVVWCLFGAAIFAFGAPIFVASGTPALVKILATLNAAVVLPYFFLVTGRTPGLSVIMPAEPTADQVAAFEKFRKAKCRCPACLRRRGEIK